MQAVRIHRFGGPEVLQLDDIDLPQPHDDELLVRVHAAGVNPVDFKTREGKFPPVTAAMLPITLGRDISGRIEACGTTVENWRKGDPVYAMLGIDRGGYAEFAVVKAVEAAPRPSRLNDLEAAAVPLAALTAWQGLFDHGKLVAGEVVLIHGGSGGVGHFAVQLAAARGAIVYTTVPCEDLEFAREIGADRAIDYRAERFEEAVHDIDLVFDLVGGETQDRSFAVLKTGGRMISTLNEPSREKAAARNIRVGRFMAEPNAAQLAGIGRMIDEGKVRPQVSVRLPIARFADAQKHLESEHVRGKVVLAIGPAHASRPRHTVAALFETRGIATDACHRLTTEGVPPKHVVMVGLKEFAFNPTVNQPEFDAMEVDPFVLGDVRDAFVPHVRNGETLILVHADTAEEASLAADTLHQYAPLRVEIVQPGQSGTVATAAPPPS